MVYKYLFGVFFISVNYYFPWLSSLKFWTRVDNQEMNYKASIENSKIRIVFFKVADLNRSRITFLKQNKALSS